MSTMPWSEVEPLPVLNGDLVPLLDLVRTLQAAWREAVKADPETFAEARRRSLRRHAVETGIIERLYDVSWGVTEALVAEGITADAVARVEEAGEGAITDDTLALIRSQYDALKFLAESAREGRDITVGLIRELHVALTKNQPTYTATDSLGRVFQAELRHGEWKTTSNHVRRSDGSLLEYTPPEQVESQLDTLIGYYRAGSDADPVIRAAWMHHGFVRIHPFQDGNGRVARCLTLLTLLRADMAPLVVERRQRTDYLSALDAANEGDLRPLVRFFARLEIVALRSELEAPAVRAPADSGALAALEAGVERLRLNMREPVTATSAAERHAKASILAAAVQKRVTEFLSDMAARFRVKLADIDAAAQATVTQAVFGSDAADQHTDPRNWRIQAVTAAKSADFYTNLFDGSWWTRLRLCARGVELRFLVFVQRVGARDTGVIALTVYGEVLRRDGTDAVRGEQVVVSSPTETVTWVYTESDDVRWDEVRHVLDMTLAVALHKYTQAMG